MRKKKSGPSNLSEKQTSKKYLDQVVHYFDTSQIWYRLICYGSNNLCMHHGYWEKGVKNRYESMNMQNESIIKHGNISSKHKVLDAGCGIGGPAIYIAQKTGAHITAITLSKKQVALAKGYAKKMGVESKTDFQVQNYMDTSFDDNTFDVVYGLESICYAYPKSKFLKEAFRILKPGGLLVIEDGYATRRPKNKNEERIIKKFEKAFEIKSLIPFFEMTSLIKDAGFKNVKEINKMKEVIPTILYFNKIFVLTRPITKFLSFLPLETFKALDRNIIALLTEKEAMKYDLATYYDHVAVKPR